jgi:hypothetical protein
MTEVWQLRTTPGRAQDEATWHHRMTEASNPLAAQQAAVRALANSQRPSPEELSRAQAVPAQERDWKTVGTNERGMREIRMTLNGGRER